MLIFNIFFNITHFLVQRIKYTLNKYKKILSDYFFIFLFVLLSLKSYLDFIDRFDYP